MDTASIAPRTLYSTLGTSHAALVFDVRRDKAYDADDRVVAGALRPTADPFALVGQHAGPVVVYCVHGHEVSQDAARALRERGIDARYLEGGIEALIPELPPRWLHPSHVQRAELIDLMSEMARSIGARGQLNQQAAMLARPDSHDDLARVRVPTLVMCGRDDPVTPVRDHEAMAAKIPGARLEIIENCGHLATIEQPESVNRVLIDWLRDTRSPNT